MTHKNVFVVLWVNFYGHIILPINWKIWTCRLRDKLEKIIEDKRERSAESLASTSDN